MLRRYATILSLPLFLLVATWMPLDRMPSVCILYGLTGYPCPGCGMTRAVTAMAHLDILHACRLNLMALPLVGGFAIWWAVSTFQMITKRTTGIGRWASERIGALAVAGFLAFLVFGVLRIGWYAAR